MMPSKRAKSEGYSEIIYLDAVEHNYVEEVGAANFFCVKDGTIYTPELTGTILPNYSAIDHRACQINGVDSGGRKGKHRFRTGL